MSDGPKGRDRARGAIKSAARKSVRSRRLVAPVSLIEGPARSSATDANQRRPVILYVERAALDETGRLVVRGWAISLSGVTDVQVFVDAEHVGTAQLGARRDDVAAAFPAYPNALTSGFSFIARIARPPDSVSSIRVAATGSDGASQGTVLPVERVAAPAVVPAVEPAAAAHDPTPEIPPAPLPPQQQFRVEIDRPRVIAGAAAEPVAGGLTIQGWAVARSGIQGIEVLLDDRRLGDAHYGLARQDVSAALPDWTDASRSGFAFHFPVRTLGNGDHVVQLRIRAKGGEVQEHCFNITVRKPEESEEGIAVRRRMPRVEVDVSEDVLNGLGHRPTFRLILRHGQPADGESLIATLESLRNQAYRDWRLEILAADAAAGIACRKLISEAAGDLAERIDVIDPLDQATFDQPIGTVDSSAAHRFIGFLTAGDQLGCDALLQIAVASGLHRGADLFYADELRISPASQEREPFFKPDFSPDLLLSCNYIGRPWFASTALLGRCGVTARDLLESGEYDAILRCTEQAQGIHHVPRLLCQRGPQQIDDSDMEAAALARAAARRGIAAEILTGAVPGTWRFRRMGEVAGKVSIIIPTCAAHGYIETCIGSLRERSTYRNFEIICIDSIPEGESAWKTWLRQNADIVVPMQQTFNWSRFNNRGAEATTSEYLLFLNDDTEVIQPDWLEAMLEHMQRPEVAVVGPQLLYPDNKVQHAGMFLATPGTARHAFRFAAADEPGYFGLALTQRNVIAVTGACMLMRRSVYQALGGFDEAHEIINNDLDFCLRAHAAGKLIVYTPHASLLHHEAASRNRLPDEFDIEYFQQRWGTLFTHGDPYFNPRLTRHSDDYLPADEPAEMVFAGHPMFHRDEIKRILVVKVDHIGDFLMAIPAIRRLKRIFPSAAIHLLAGRAVRAFAEMEDCIDEFVEFEFFHPVSALGPKEISEEEYRALRERLTPYRFDIAVDLRKHPDTRDLLRYTHARFLAGYDYMGQFPFLDIALEWESDKHLVHKRSHVADDLLNLVEAIGTACIGERMQLATARPEGLPDFLTEKVRALFVRPMVAVHPGVGNVMRQWPAEHFASLIDLLVERNAVNVVLIGGPEETELADQVLGMVSARPAVASLVGRTSLRQLAELLPACALYIGNDSGPKHIAAALGVPTIGVHSGVVDANQWGPVGKRAVAVRRNMACSPCYLARMEDCPRNFACMHGLEPSMVQEVAEFFLARPVGQRAVRPLIELEPEVIPPPVQKSRQRSTDAVKGRQPRRKSRRLASTVTAQ